MKIEKQQLTKRERRLIRAMKEVGKFLLSLIMFITCIFLVVELWFSDFYSVYDAHMNIIWGRKIIRWLMYDGLFVIIFLSGVAMYATAHRAWFDLKMILADD